MSRFVRLCGLFFFALCGVSCGVTHRVWSPQSEVAEAAYLVVSKSAMRLSVVDSCGHVVAAWPIACGANYGNKQREGDKKTPEGVFTVQEVLAIPQPEAWKASPSDEKGSIYGPYFIRLLTPPHTGIGIHGTNQPESVGSRATLGCVRLRNRDLEALMPYIRLHLPVYIAPSEQDAAAASRL